jgi:MATE family multidrug resistance protein
MSHKEYKDGSIKELLSISFPLMVSWLSTTVMLLVDRLFLANYSLESLAASVHAGTIAWAFVLGIQTILEMAQIVVAKYNGAKRFEDTARPSWQMIWLALGSVFFFVPFAFFGSQMFAGELQQSYFFWFVLFAPVAALMGAVCSYFIGRGEGSIVTKSSLIGNSANIFLDWLLIFGVDGYIPAMGVKGAAIATGLGISIQAFILLACFIWRSKSFSSPTQVWHWNWTECKTCLQASLPPGIFMMAEIFGWGMFYSMMNYAGPKHIIVSSICASILPLVSAFTSGLQKGTAALSGNLIGAGLTERLTDVLKNGVILLAGYFVLTIGLLLLFPGLFLNPFLSESSAGDIQRIGENFELIRWNVFICLIISFVYLFCGGIRLLIMGILSATGDARFLLIAGTASIWIFLLAPTYFVVVLGHASVIVAQSLLLIYGMIGCSIYYLRFRQGKWKTEANLIKS